MTSDETMRVAHRRLHLPLEGESFPTHSKPLFVAESPAQAPPISHRTNVVARMLLCLMSGVLYST